MARDFGITNFRAGAAPTSPVQGDTYWDTTTLAAYVWNGTIWVPLGGGGMASPLGIVASGISVGTPASGQLLNVSNVISGNPAWLVSHTITIPAGADGLYLINVSAQILSPTVAAVGVAVRTSAGADYSPQMRVMGMITAGNPENNIHGSWVRQCVAGETFQVRNFANPISGGSARVDRFSFVRLADTLAAS